MAATNEVSVKMFDEMLEYIPAPPTIRFSLLLGVFRLSNAKTPATNNFDATSSPKRAVFKSQPLCAKYDDLPQDSSAFWCRKY